MRRPASLLPVLALAACRFGGPSADPDAYVASPPDSGSKAALADDGTDDATIATIDALAMTPPLSDDASPDVASPPLPDGDAGNAGGCAPTVAVCNPVRNTGCNPLQQCDVDTSQKTTPTGLCVFNSGSEGGGACTTTIFTESCPAQSTCVNGACRALCFCDTDCPAGSCCTDTSGPAGFTLCAKCP